MHDKNDHRFEWKNFEQQQINDLLKQCNNEMPAEIHRSIRSLNHIKYWKGTEYRTFLLYVGIVVLKDFLTQELYEHFLVLVSAVSICYCDAYKKYLSIAKKLFDEFIESYIEIYGIDEIGSNMHNLNHIVDDVNRFGITLVHTSLKIL